MRRENDNRAGQVHWYEGMFLQSHHFQMSDRHRASEFFENIQATQPFHWGVAELKMNETALAGYRIKLEQARFRLKDGTWIHLPENAHAEECIFEDLHGKGLEAMDVWVGIRRPEPYSPLIHDLGEDNTGTVRTHVLRETRVYDENTGENEKTVQVRLWNVRVFVGAKPGDQYESMRIGELSLSESNRPEFKSDFTAAFLNIGASTYLTERLRNLEVRLNNQAAFLKKEMAARRIVLNTDPTRVIENLLRLQVSGSFGLSLKQMTAVGEIHPFPIYLELCRLAGNLSALSPDTPLAVPDYDHDHCGDVISKLISAVEEMVDGNVVVDYVHREFEFTDGCHKCRLDREWLEENSEKEGAFYLCITSGNPEDHVDNMLSNLSVKIGPPSRIQDIMLMRTQGMACRRIRRIPAGLPDRSGLHYFQLDFSRRSDFYEDLCRDLMLVIDGISVEDISGMGLYVYIRKDKA